MPKLKDPNVWFQNALKVTEDPATSDWLKKGLVEAINRDPVDAAQDAEVLYRILNLRTAAVQKAHLVRRSRWLHRSPSRFTRPIALILIGMGFAPRRSVRILPRGASQDHGHSEGDFPLQFGNPPSTCP
jgi:hypothetical protein